MRRGFTVFDTCASFAIVLDRENAIILKAESLMRFEPFAVVNTYEEGENNSRN